MTTGLCDELKSSQNVGTYWLLSCARCHQHVRMCGACYGGRRYCTSCAELAREDSKKRARIRYQKSPKGKEQHRLAQARYRQRKADEHHMTSKCTVDREVTSVRVIGIATVPDDQLELPTPEDETNVECDGSATFLSTAQEPSKVFPGVSRLRHCSPETRHTTIACDMCGASCGSFALQPGRVRHRKNAKKQNCRSPAANGSRKRVA